MIDALLAFLLVWGAPIAYGVLHDFWAWLTGGERM